MTRFVRRQLGGLEVAWLDCTGHIFVPHFHDAFVLGINLEGAESLRIGRKQLEAHKREITLVNPAEVNSSSALSSTWRFLSLHVEPVMLMQAFDLSDGTVFERAVLSQEDTASRLIDAIRFALEVDAGDEEACERLIGILDELLQVAGSCPAARPPAVPSSIRRVAERLRDDVPVPTLAELAEEAGLSRVQLLRAFTRAYGLPPIAWSMSARLNEASARLKRGEAIAEVAADLGFADQAHLTRRFRNAFGVAPGRWRAG